VVQDKNKYHSPKYRFVVRLTNRDVICQVVAAKVKGDEVITAAYAHELPRYGVKTGLTNYASVYCVGLLAARRLLQKYKLDDKYVGQATADGEMYLVDELDDGPRPFTAYLDVGLARTTTGARIFAALKGAVDGGLRIPHNEKRFPGYDAESKELDADTLRKRIFGEHITEYMKLLLDDNPDRYNKQFSTFIKSGIKPDDLPKIYKAAHAAIRKSPALVKKTAKANIAKKRFGAKRLTHAERKARVAAKMAAHEAAGGDDADEEDDA
jgi:large subunit ribosomal protein L5e